MIYQEHQGNSDQKSKITNNFALNLNTIFKDEFAFLGLFSINTEKCEHTI